MISIRSSILASVTLSACLTLSATMLVATNAAAQAAIAEGLFRDGKKLLDEKKYADACPKFEESVRLEPSSGVELALGICYEALGKTASAWAAYQTAVSLARRDNRKDREHAAIAKANALEPKLAHATIEVPTEVARLPGLQVKEDGVAFGAAAWKNAPVDAGDHTLEVSATGKKSWTGSFTIDAAHTSVTVTVPKLEDEPQVVTQQQQQQQVGGGGVVIEQRTSNPFRTVSYVTLSAGLVTVVAASILGGIAIADASDAHKACPSSSCSDARAVSENNTAGSLADWSTVLFVTSGVCFAATVVFFLLHPPAPARVAVHPLIGPTAVGIGGVF